MVRAMGLPGRIRLFHGASSVCGQWIPDATVGVRAGQMGVLVALAGAGCAPMARADAPLPELVPAAAWRAEAPVGRAADATRRNLVPGDSLRFGDLGLRVVAAGAEPPTSLATLALSHGGEAAEVRVAAGAAVRWGGHRVAVLSVRGEGELGAGLVELEVATLASLPAHIAASDTAGGAEMRLRIPHRITHVTLHHTGSPEPLRPGDDPVERLRGLQRWGRTDRNWWDVPYHFLIDLDGRIYEGRDWRYMGETNTAYDPRGHFLISVIGNYALQEATPAQLEAITALMAWAVARFDVPLDRIGGHYDYAATTCPGTHLVRYLEDGTIRRGVAARLGRGARP
jgi:hypothetical protein